MKKKIINFLLISFTLVIFFFVGFRLYQLYKIETSWTDSGMQVFYYTLRFDNPNDFNPQALEGTHFEIRSDKDLYTYGEVLLFADDNPLNDNLYILSKRFPEAFLQEQEIN